MKYIRFVLILLCLLVILLIGVFSFSKPKKIFITEYHPNYLNIYPKTNFIKFENKDFLIKEIYTYQLNILMEIQFSGSEGFAGQKIDFFDLFNNEDQRSASKYLKFKKIDKEIIYDSKTYPISEQRQDTVFTKINDSNVILFVN